MNLAIHSQDGRLKGSIILYDSREKVTEYLQTKFRRQLQQVTRHIVGPVLVLWAEISRTVLPRNAVANKAACLDDSTSVRVRWMLACLVHLAERQLTRLLDFRFLSAYC